MHEKALITDWQTEAGAAYDEATKRVYFISCICCCLSSHPWAGTAFMHTASIPSQQQLAFLQDKGFRESQQGKQKLHVTSLSQHLWLSASCTHQCTQALRSAESRQNCMSYVAAASKHRRFKGCLSHSFHFCYAHSLPWKMFLMLLQVLPWLQTPFSIRTSCTFYPLWNAPHPKRVKVFQKSHPRTRVASYDSIPLQAVSGPSVAFHVRAAG